MNSATRADTCCLFSTPVTHHGSSTSVVSSATDLSAGSSAAASSAPSSCVSLPSARAPHSSPQTVPIVSRPPKFFFSRAFAFSSSGGAPSACSRGCSPTRAVCSARVSGDAHSAPALNIAWRAAASAADAGPSPAGSAAAAARAICSAFAWRYPFSLSGWSTADTIPITSFFFCASFHALSPWRTKKTCFCRSVRPTR